MLLVSTQTERQLRSRLPVLTDAVDLGIPFTSMPTQLLA
jgi:hypothetical protein